MALVPRATTPRLVPWAMSVARRAVDGSGRRGGGVTERGEGARKATPTIHRHQELFTAHPWQRGLNSVAEFLHPGRDVQGIIAFGTEPILRDADTGMSRPAGDDLLRHGIKRLPEGGERLIGGPGHRQCRRGLGLFRCPWRIIIDQCPEGHMAPTRRERERARA